MKSNLIFIRSIVLIILCCFGNPYLYAQSVNIQRNAKDNTVQTVSFPEGARPSMDKIDDVLSQYVGLDKTSELKLKFANEQGDGFTVTRYTQWYQGIKVEHSSVSVMAINNAITYINANVFKPNHILQTVAVLSEVEALNVALQQINATSYAWEHPVKSKLTKDNSSYQPPVATLVWVEDFTNEELDKQLHLAYRFDIYAVQPLSRDVLFIDAVTGKMLLKDPVLKHVGATGTSIYSGVVGFNAANTSLNTYEMYDSVRKVETYDIGGGTNLGFAQLISSSSTTFAKSVGVDAHWGATMVYDYWKNEHNRNSYDGAGSELSSVVNYDIGYNNAFWNGFAMFYGNGTGMFNSGIETLVALDVCAHEVGHGICEYTSGLVYNRESGAMNEGFSDIWGAVIEDYAAPDKQMWAIGEEIRLGALRSMSNPKLFDDPNCYDGNFWTNTIGCSPNNGNDQCGVHSNSGVLNYWFYLLVEGGAGTNDLSNSYQVAGIGVKKAAKIAYAAEQALSPAAKFIECRSVSIAAATTIYGACSKEVEAVTRAWYAVGVGAAFAPCAPQIGFEVNDVAINKAVSGNICPSSKTISIPVRVVGNAPTGGNASVAIAGAGTAINGVDYKILNSPLVFNSGSSTSQMIQVSILDNGDVTGDKELKLYATITPNGSNASLSYTYDTCVVTISGARAVPDTLGSKISTVNTSDIKSKAITPFFSRNKFARTQFIITAEELRASGVRANEQITALQFNVTEKNSIPPFANFNLKIDATTVANVGGGNPTVSTVYYSSSFSTQLGWNTLTFSTPLIWNGLSNLAIETCFSNNTAGTENDYIQGIVTNDPATSVSHSDLGSNGCSLLFTSGQYFYSISKPVIRLVQPTFGTEAERIVYGSKPWELSPVQNVYFRNDTSGKLLMNISNVQAPLGCTNTAITVQGDGLSTIAGAFYNAVKRSVKEFAIVPTNNPIGTPTQYELTLYYDTAELSGVNLANIVVVGTNAGIDTSMNEINTEIISAVTTTTTGSYIAIKATFTSKSPTGFAGGIWNRYFIADNIFNLRPVESVETISKNSGNIRVVNNPFTDKIYLNYNLSANTKAQIKLYDITGKVVLATEKNLRADGSNFDINVGDKLLTPGNYVLQVVTDTEVMTQKMVKQ